MARTFGKLLCSAWDDDEFIATSSDAKVLYWAFCSQRDISAAGVLPIVPRRWRRWFSGDQQAAEAALDELVAGEFVLIDDDTAELWVRSFIKHDGRLDNVKLRRSVHEAARLIQSETLRDACYRALEDLGWPIPETQEGPSQNQERPSPVDNSPSLPSDDETPGRRPIPESGKDNTEIRNVAAASSQQPRPLNEDQQPAAANRDGTAVDNFDAVVHELVLLRLRQEMDAGKARNPPGLKRSLEQQLPDEHGDEIRRLLDTFPEAPTNSIAAATLTGDTRPLAGYRKEDL